MPEADILVKKLTNGIKRKLSIALALIGEPLFIILDEPTSNIDHEAKIHIWEVIKDMSLKRAILIST